MAKRRRKPGLRSSAWIRRGKRLRIYARDGYVCVWCGKTPDLFTLDHLFPVASRWRDNNPRRLVTACLSCNLSRKDRSVATWLRLLRARPFLDDFTGAMERLRRARTTPLPDRADPPPNPTVEVFRTEEEWEELERLDRERWIA